MNKKNYLFLFVMGLIAYFSFDKIKEPEPTSEIQLQESREPFIPKPVRTISSKKVMTSTLPSEIRALHDHFPDKEKVDQDLEAHPHTPSETLMSFAQSLGPLMEKGFKDRRYAGALIEELSQCAIDESVAASARAMCVTNVERLEGKHVKLKKTASELRAHVSKKVQQILKTNDAMMKSITE